MLNLGRVLNEPYESMSPMLERQRLCLIDSMIFSAMSILYQGSGCWSVGKMSSYLIDFNRMMEIRLTRNLSTML
jgi:hypothetical protein